MKLAIFGGTGRVGKQVCEQAIEDGHQVNLLVRAEADWMQHPNIQVTVGDAKKAEDIEKVLDGADAVFSGLGTDKTTTLTEFSEAIIPLLTKHGISRIVTIGTAGILNSRHEEGKYRFQTNESNRKLTFAAEQHAHVYERFARTDHQWTIVCPTYLPDGLMTGTYRTEVDYHPEDGNQISTGDTAYFAYKQLHQKDITPSRIGIAY
ncbi:NAD(P)-dependent oxidoreductase [Chryseomicrobium palamuruense]|uniref:NAD(P)-dependent oxidoreductase n=1 Tax=Chryseomicrobium palamuruense TaxID=682973 RepID=A0ABV8UVS7_9BACL